MTSKPQSSLFRISKMPDGALFVSTGKEPHGRSVYVCQDSECILRAKKKRAINRSLRSDIPSEVQDEIWDTLLKKTDAAQTGPSCQSRTSCKKDRYLGLARKSGNLAAGYDTCIELIRKKKVNLMILTEDVSQNTKEKFYGLSEKNKIPIYTYGTCSHMSHITGMPNRSIFAILDKNLAKAIEDEFF